jgi:flavoprotein
MVLRRVVTLILTFARRIRRAERQQDPELRLELCGLCGRDFVNPVEWEPMGSEWWRILLRCGECGTWREVTVTNAVAQRYDVELDRRAVGMTALLDRMDRERMLGQAEAMKTALELGLIDAADFAVTRSA